MNKVVIVVVLVLATTTLAVPRADASKVVKAAAKVFAKAHASDEIDHAVNLRASHVISSHIQASANGTAAHGSRNGTSNGNNADGGTIQPTGGSGSRDNFQPESTAPIAVKLKSGNPLPIDVTWSGGPLVVRGRCVDGCRPSHAVQLETFSWTTSRTTPLPYTLSVKLRNPLIVQSVNFNSASVLESDNGKNVAIGLIPTEKKPVNASAAPSRFASISYQPSCLSRGVSNVHIVIASPDLSYDPVHLFFLTSCSVPVSPLCDNVDCGVPNRGVCINGTCLCGEGFSGANCESSIFDVCPNNCHGNADNCVHDSTSGSFVCVCKDGFSGQECEFYSGCTNDTLGGCSGHGQCIDDEVCACDYAWRGRICDIERSGDSFCSELSYCRGHGRCERDGNTHVCVCDEGFEGSDCGSAVVDACPNQCSGHGVCTAGSCQCNFGYSGLDCSDAFSPCGGCNGGTCSESVDTTAPTCHCPPAFGGRHCLEYDMSRDICRNSSFCNGHGRCSTGTSVCQCDPGFSGRQCSQVVPEGCANNCNGHGQCGAQDTCECDESWSGEECSFPRCPTTNGTMCSGHGACVDLTNAVETTKICQCGDGFFGVSCSNAVCKANVTCGSHGKCKKSSGQWDRLCACDSGFSGPRCQQVATAPPTAFAASALKRTQNARNYVVDEDDLDDFLDVVPRNDH